MSSGGQSSGNTEDIPIKPEGSFDACMKMPKRSKTTEISTSVKITVDQKQLEQESEL